MCELTHESLCLACLSLYVERNLQGKLKENEKPYEKFIRLISDPPAFAKHMISFELNVERPFYFNGASVHLVFQVELNSMFYQMIGAVNQQNQNCESPDLSNIKIGQRFTEEQRKGALAQFNLLKPSAPTAKLPDTCPRGFRGGRGGDEQASYCV